MVGVDLQGDIKDWNWFFSSLSQSSAAIVGIFGAFIITKILSNNSNFDNNIIISKKMQSGWPALLMEIHHALLKRFQRADPHVDMKHVCYIWSDGNLLVGIIR